MGFTSVLDASTTEKAIKFLVVFGEVSSILKVNADHTTDPSHLFEVDENLESVSNMDDVFMKIVVSLQMNKEDPGLRTLREMSSRATQGEPLDEIISRVEKEDASLALGLCTDVIAGVKYTLRNEGGDTHSDSMNVSRSFIQYLETSLGS